MRVERLRLADIRCVRQAELALQPGLNWITGDNGAGKSSVLESLSLLATGKSFRAGGADGLICRDADAAIVFAEVVDGLSGKISRVGFERRRRDYEARIDGLRPDSLAELFSLVPVLCVEPDAGTLISGPGELRRRFIDWALFHVEPKFLSVWRRFQRVLRQRNALLRTRPRLNELAVWDEEFAIAGEALNALRSSYHHSLYEALVEHSAWLLPQLGTPQWRFRPGWQSSDGCLAEALVAARESDIRLGFSTVGPQRGGWLLTYPGIPRREAFSRGQAKSAALACCLAQATAFLGSRGQPPVLVLDDVMSELDANRQQGVLHAISVVGAQTLLATAGISVPLSYGVGSAVFHVEQGVVTRQV